MSQGLFEARGAQPPKPSRWKPVWTDRFFNGYVTNRSPFRSPLSSVYSEGYNLGRSDTLLAGVNSEISPRLTPIRRPGNPAYTTTTFPVAPNTFYSYKLANDAINIMVDAADGVYVVTHTAKTLIYSKPAGASQSNFCGVGNLLYWGDGTTARAWSPINNTVYRLGIQPAAPSPDVPQYLAIGSATPITGPDFTAGGYVSTAVAVANNFTQSVEVWARTAGTGVQPLVSFESSSTGTSTTVYQSFYLQDGAPVFSYFDGTTQQVVQLASPWNDNEWHQFGYSIQYTADITNAISYTTNGPAKQLNAGSQNLNPDEAVTTNFSYNTSPSFSSAAAPSKLQISLWVDGQQITNVTPTPANSGMATGNGYWRIANTSLYPTAPFQGMIAQVATRHDVLVGFNARFQAMMLTGDPLYPLPGILAYEQAVLAGTYGLDYYWRLNELTGTVAVEFVAGINNGTYHPTVTLGGNFSVRYKPYASSTAYGTLFQTIVDTNGNLQYVVQTGTTGTSAPTWSTIPNTNTTDGTVIWSNRGPGAVVATIGMKYCYCFVSKYGHFSTATTVNQPGLAGVGTRGGLDINSGGSDDPQVAYIAIFRTVDGGTTPFLVDMIPNGGTQHRWHYFDTTPDANLNILMAAPQAHSNDPAPEGLTCLVYHLGRTWGAVGNLLYASGGPDTLVGNGNEAWPPANSWGYPSQIIRLVPHSTGLLVCTSSGTFLHAGGPAITQFYPQPLFEKIGIANWNALDASVNEVTMFSSGRQLLTVDLLNNTLTDIGFPIQDQLQSLDPSQVYVVRHHGGLDDAVFVGDGATGWFKCVPRQPPDYTITGPIWSPFAQVSHSTAPLPLANEIDFITEQSFPAE